MSIDWHNGAPDRRTLLPESYKPKALRLATAAESYTAAAPEQSVIPAQPALPAGAESPTLANDTAAQDAPEQTPSVVDLRKLEAQLGRKRLDEIADVVRALTYGEMIELAQSMWNVKPDDSDLNESNLPAVLYRWSTSRRS